MTISIFYFSADLWSLLWKSSNYNEIEAHLTTHSVIILLILVNHCAGPNNPYRQALSSYDRDLAAVYKSLCSTIHREENTLLLYHLLHVNQNFKTFLLAQTDIENLVSLSVSLLGEFPPLLEVEQFKNGYLCIMSI